MNTQTTHQYFALTRMILVWIMVVDTLLGYYFLRWHITDGGGGNSPIVTLIFLGAVNGTLLLFFVIEGCAAITHTIILQFKKWEPCISSKNDEQVLEAPKRKGVLG